MASAPSSLSTLFGIAGLAVALLYFFPQRRKSFVESHPPGPKSPSMPALDAWVQYKEWGREYGDLVYIHEHNMLILNDARTATDLLDKRARIYLDRPMTNMMRVSGFDGIIALQQYSDKWQRNRKLFQQHFRQNANSRFYPAVYKKIHRFLRELAAVPEEFMEHTASLSQGLIFASLYGLDIGSKDPISRKAVEVVAMLGQIIIQPFPSVELFPWLRFMPSWFPGCGFQRIANKLTEYIKEVDTIPFVKAVDNLKSGTGTSLIAELAHENEGNPTKIDEIKAMGTMSFLAAADTTMSSISSFLLTITQHPEVHLKAQAEIDRVIGRDRLPTFEDRRSLPYIESIYQEIMRMHPPLPLGLFHVSIEDDVYQGYHIPKGCVVVPNIWAMNRDPKLYSNPDEFMPERFFDSPTGPFTSIGDIYAYGFGRRVCVGRYLADSTVWLAIASVLATLDLRKAKDDGGNEIDISGEYTKSFLRHPEPYQSSITPRDLQARELILATAESTM
ncbi:cytochrome P450 1 [Rhodocollybia butyracea]|uniref:Cytochrome P450 1 n=1 Tax=Rhodocollybia butyracea TaxID=206335 RepID=A0A9P5QBB4_9AGAR|nr:cytochrome P450 1 [Rhodocollybia butyracea]